MSEPRVLVCGPSPERMAPAQALEMLRQVTLPHAAKVVVTNGKFDTQKAAKTFNLEAGYPPEPAQLQTLSTWAGLPARSSEQYRDGFDLFALRAVLRRDGPFDYVLLLRARADLEERWAELRDQVEGKLFVTFDDDNVLFDFRDVWTTGFLERAWELYVTGTVYAIDDYSLQAALAAAANAVRLEREIASD